MELEQNDVFDGAWLGSADPNDILLEVEYEASVGSTPKVDVIQRAPPTDSVPYTSQQPCTNAESPHSQALGQYAAPKTDTEIISVRDKGIPEKNQQDTKYCTKQWDEWRQHRMKATCVTIAELHLLSSKELAYWLTHFIQKEVWWRVHTTQHLLWSYEAATVIWTSQYRLIQRPRFL